MPAPDLIAGFYGSQGVLLGVTLNGFLVVPSALFSGIMMQDSSLNWWVLSIGTDGRLSTTQVTI
jgi:hypothetical protein